MRAAQLLVLLIAPVLAWGSNKECDVLKQRLATQQYDQGSLSKSLNSLDRLVASDSLCGKNLLGRLYYEGVNAPKDVERGYAIFFELANRGYPPAQFNLAYALTRDAQSDPAVVVALLQGLIVTYTNDEDYRYLALKARDLGREYLTKLDPNLRATLATNFETAILNSTTQAAMDVVAKSNARRQRDEAILEIIAIGISVGLAANAISSLYQAPPVTTFNSLQPQFYSVHPSGGSMLYLIPHF